MAFRVVDYTDELVDKVVWALRECAFAFMDRRYITASQFLFEARGLMEAILILADQSPTAAKHYERRGLSKLYDKVCRYEVEVGRELSRR